MYLVRAFAVGIADMHMRSMAVRHCDDGIPERARNFFKA